MIRAGAASLKLVRFLIKRICTTGIIRRNTLQPGTTKIDLMKIGITKVSTRGIGITRVNRTRIGITRVNINITRSNWS